MLTSLLLSASILLTLAALIFDYVRSKRRENVLNAKFKAQEAELKLTKENAAELENKLNEQAAKLQEIYRDPITQLPGWQLFSDRLNQNILESSRYQFTLGVLFIDINDFKVINDVLGHEVGDALLKEVGKRLQGCVRQIDTIARFSKDIFVVMLAQLSKPESAAIIAQRMLQSLAQSMQIDEHAFHVTASIGMAFYPLDGEDSTTLLRNADQALHVAKQSGKQSYHFYQERLQSKSKRELALYTALSRETIFDDLYINYQPMMNVDNESILCMEALVHLNHPEYGVVSSQEIYSYAEKLHKVNAVSEWLLQNACKQFARWKSLGFNPELLAIPLSAKQLENSHFIYRMSLILQESGFNPNQLMVELHDDFRSISFDIIEKAFNMLKYLGIKVAIDDFGSDSLSLHYLKNLTVWYIKLDHRFIDDVVISERTKSLVKSLVYFADNMAMTVVAKGVESKDQVDVLKGLGCHFMQGRFVCEPMSDEEVVKNMSSNPAG